METESHGMEGSLVSEDHGYKDSTRLTAWVRFLIYAQVVVAVVSIVSHQMEYQLLSDFRMGVYTSEVDAIAAGEASDLRQSVVAIAYLLVFIVSGVLILMWIYRANYNARQLGAEGMKFSPGWSVGWYFIPIATLWKPYQAMKEIWRASHAPTDWQNSPATALLPLWWFFWLASNALGQTVSRMSARAEEIVELMDVNRIYVASDVFDIALALTMLSLVNGIYRAQVAHARADTRVQP